jgi:hypothetical protein
MVRLEVTVRRSEGSTEARSDKEPTPWPGKFDGGPLDIFSARTSDCVNVDPLATREELEALVGKSS